MLGSSRGHAQCFAPSSRRRLVKAQHSGSGTEHSDEDESSESLVSEYESLESESANESAEEGATDALGIYDDADPEVYTEVTRSCQ